MMAETLDRPVFLERHYTCGELAKAWGFSMPTVRKWFRHEPGVIIEGEDRLLRGRQRVYVTMRIPEHVARRVYERHVRKV